MLRGGALRYSVTHGRVYYLSHAFPLQRNHQQRKPTRPPTTAMTATEIPAMAPVLRPLLLTLPPVLSPVPSPITKHMNAPVDDTVHCLHPASPSEHGLHFVPALCGL
eukprot:XP_001705786.1 Hypothetical protein GL50803_20165 [Giardia lamblia ATCC 50803]